jgi:hypothetical protein
VPPADFLVICVTGFVAVFALLALLALLMRLLILLFPDRFEKETDAATIAALTVTMSSLYPGTRITRIEQQK